jgi:hypothetical protein
MRERQMETQREKLEQQEMEMERTAQQMRTLSPAWSPPITAGDKGS